MHKIYVALSTFAKEDPAPLELLKNSGVDFTLNQSGKRLTKQELIMQANEATVIIAGLEPYDQDVLTALTQLKCISRCGVGVDNIDLILAKSKGITVLNTPDVVVNPVAELTIALIFDVLRRLTQQALLMRQRQWPKITGNMLVGKTVGIVGLGRIGKRVAILLQGLGARVIAHDLYPDHAWAKGNNVMLVDWPHILRESDILSLHAAPQAGAGTLVDAPALSSMKKGSFLINTSRGQLVDEQALFRVISEGHLAGAGLDVYHQEPYQGPLLDLPNVVCTGHIATLTHESRTAMEQQAIENALTFIKGAGAL